MKGYKDVDATRLQQRERPAVNSVHRSSLLVPQIGGASTEIAFLNHFLIKRKYEHVACRITGVDRVGRRIESQLHPIRERRVYRFELSALFEGAAAYQIEFFAADNLFIPFPAVMVNHYGDDFINTVHAFNRVLNDVFEDDELTHAPVAETGIEVTLSGDTDTVCWLMSGMSEMTGTAELVLDTAQTSHRKTIPLTLPRFGVQTVSVSEAFPEAGNVRNGLVRILQPQQKMFYGRLLGARMHRATGAFSGNHSYYDTRSLDETWGNALPSSQIFAYSETLPPRIRMHPEFPAGRAMTLDLTFFDSHGSPMMQTDAGTLRSPGPYVELDMQTRIRELGLDGTAVGSFELRATPVDGNTLARVAYHLLYGAGGLEGSSIIALGNPNVKPRDPNAGRTWGQAVIGRNFTTLLMIAPGQRSANHTHCRLEFYDERGALGERTFEIVPNGGLVIDVERELAAELEGRLHGRHHVPVWFYLDADRSDINAHAVTSHRVSGHTTVEHTF